MQLADESIEQFITNLYQLVRLNGKIMLFKIDTGAEVSEVNEQTFNSVMPSAPLNTLSKVLHGPSR